MEAQTSIWASRSAEHLLRQCEFAETTLIEEPHIKAKVNVVRRIVFAENFIVVVSLVCALLSGIQLFKLFVVVIVVSFFILSFGCLSRRRRRLTR